MLICIRGSILRSSLQMLAFFGASCMQHTIQLPALQKVCNRTCCRKQTFPTVVQDVVRCCVVVRAVVQHHTATALIKGNFFVF